MVEFFPTERVILTIGPVTIYWYGLLYVVAFGVAYGLWPSLQRYRGLSLSRSQVLEVVTWGAVGVVVGGRLGYVLLYAPLYYMAHPEEIIQLSQGGMSSHGGFVGVAVAIWLYVFFMERGARQDSRVLPRHALLRSDELRKGEAPRLPREARQGEVGARHPLFALLDIIVVPASIGLALGRLGNVINQELYITPLAQLIAVGVPLFIAVACYWHLRRGSERGATTGLFLILYSVARFGEELVREPEWSPLLGWMTWGQLYTVPLLLLGLGWWLLPRSFAVWFRDEAG